MDLKEYITKNIDTSALIDEVSINYYERPKTDPKSIANFIAMHANKLFFKTKHFLRDTLLKSVIKTKIIFVGDDSKDSLSKLNQMLKENKYDIVGYLTTKSISKHIPIRVFGTFDILETVYNKGVTTTFISINDKELLKKVTKFAKKLGYRILDHKI